jgi:hypothetical protein
MRYAVHKFQSVLGELISDPAYSNADESYYPEIFTSVGKAISDSAHINVNESCNLEVSTSVRGADFKS